MLAFRADQILYLENSVWQFSLTATSGMATLALSKCLLPIRHFGGKKLNTTGLKTGGSLNLFAFVAGQ